jgi:hypothetical protein
MCIVALVSLGTIISAIAPLTEEEQWRRDIESQKRLMYRLAVESGVDTKPPVMRTIADDVDSFIGSRVQ